MTELVVDVIVDAPAQQVWDFVMDWERQGEWIAATSVVVAEGDGRSVGSRIEARTGFGPAAFVDTMVVTAMDAPHRCDVDHIGSVVRGTGAFEVQALPSGKTRFIWTEDLDLPLGAIGAMGWPLLKPAVALGVRHSLNVMAGIVEGEAA